MAKTPTITMLPSIGAPDPAADLRLDVIRINGQISKAMDLALALADPGPAVRKVNELEAQRAALAAEVARLEREHRNRAMLALMTEERVASVLGGIASDLGHTPPERWKSLLHALIGRIDLDPESLECQIRYRITADQTEADTLNMASPRGCCDWGIEATRKIRWR